MASGTPTVVSSHPSLDEASGDAAVRVDPESPEAIAEGITRALEERESLVERGLRHAERFTWRACGEAMLRGYESARG
jgi:glycosyltransferase involved in cell wall biosynthesis